MLKKLAPNDFEVISVKYISKLTPKLILPAFSIGIVFEYFSIKFSSFLENPVVPITTLFLSFDAISSICRVHSGIVKSIIISDFSNVFFIFNVGFIPLIFLLTFLFSVRATSLNALFLSVDSMRWFPILPKQPVIAKFIFFIILIPKIS